MGFSDGSRISPSNLLQDLQFFLNVLFRNVLVLLISSSKNCQQKQGVQPILECLWLPWKGSRLSILHKHESNLNKYLEPQKHPKRGNCMFFVSSTIEDWYASTYIHLYVVNAPTSRVFCGFSRLLSWFSLRFLPKPTNQPPLPRLVHWQLQSKLQETCGDLSGETSCLGKNVASPKTGEKNKMCSYESI